MRTYGHGRRGTGRDGATTDGTYVRFVEAVERGRSSVELVFDIRAPRLDDLLIGKLRFPTPLRPRTKAIRTELRVMDVLVGLRHGPQDHTALLMA